MNAHAISDFAPSNNFAVRLRAMVAAFLNRLDSLMTTDPDAYPM